MFFCEHQGSETWGDRPVRPSARLKHRWKQVAVVPLPDWASLAILLPDAPHTMSSLRGREELKCCAESSVTIPIAERRLQRSKAGLSGAMARRDVFHFEVVA